LKIAVDAFGGDNAPLEIIKGAKMAYDEYKVDIILVGDEKITEKVCKENNISLDGGIKIKHAPDIIGMEDPPTEITRSKKESSMAVGLRMLKEDEADGFISAGNSGALTVGATLTVKRIKGVKRCAFAPVVPKETGFFMLIDSGANSECRPEMLQQFGVMGSIYMEKVMGVNKPRVGLVNVGTEEHKGDTLRKETYKLLSESNINFIGNIESREVPKDAAEVVVCDGFTGNIILKMYEGMATVLMGKFKEILSKNIKTKLAASLILPELRNMKKNMDYNEYGGAAIIGISKPVFKAHGSSNAKTVKNAIRLTRDYIQNNVVKIISQSI
jgi:glycerol-3-phosphate acyltransferase PlsX